MIRITRRTQSASPAGPCRKAEYVFRRSAPSKTCRLPAMCRMTKPTMISPDTAMTIFLPTVLAKNVGARITEGSQCHRRHRLPHGVGALRERRALVVGERHLENL